MGDTPDTSVTNDDDATSTATEPDWKTEAEKAQADAEKWKGLARKHETRAKENADAARRVAEIDDANKTAEQKAAEAAQRADAAEARALRYEVAADKALPRDAMGFLTGSTREELESNADRLLELMKAKGNDASTATGGTPKEKLRPASGTANDDDEDIDKIVSRIPRF